MKLFLISLLFLLISQAPAAPKAINQEDLNQRMTWFNDAKFGMFIHWGAYSVLKGSWQGKEMEFYAEWIQAKADIPKEEYEQVAAAFNPKQFDADAWVKAASDAGMKYLVITTKHHEGFCLWDSKYTTFDIKDTAGIDRDLLGELSQSCKKYGLKFGTYYSIIDWHHDSQVSVEGAKGHWNKWAKMKMVSPVKKRKYIQYMKNQLQELVDKYDTQIFWFDGDWNDFWTMEDGQDLYRFLRKIQPTAIINNRVAKRKEFKYDFGTPENQTPGEKLDYFWEACWTINHSWGYKAHDTKWKSGKVLIQKLIDINSKGGNLLLNVGPTPEGTFPDGCIERLNEMGKWTQTHAKVLYNTEYAPVKASAWGRVLKKNNKLFLHVFDWPNNNQLQINGLEGTLTKAYVFNQPQVELEYESISQGFNIHIPSKAYDDNSSVIVLEFAEDSLSFPKNPDRKANSSNDISLPLSKASITGSSIVYEKRSQSLRSFNSNKDSVSWKQEIVIPGNYEVILNTSLKGSESTFEMKFNNQTLKGQSKNTDKWGQFEDISLGKINLDQIGAYTISLRKTSTNHGPLFKLKSIRLRPIE
ncbi:alpha-L-fucosidase [Lentisphaera profundi]|uniref:alpha-L-fucosidase n=1 Tax=Lentisphaera profundi TaxID=1658616 RepID=A0ABY7VMZ1_9BACT|nr:alpha-L-fucosidase [Lentisphaera profundi]WDE95436.1 alpha-L-fucosidase [Lentisphaera profundi]